MFAFTKLMQTMVASGTVSDPYFYLTTLLLNTTSTNGAQNNTFLDSSSNGYSITRNPATGPNAPTQGTFSPFSQTGWSNYFNGSSALNIAANSAFDQNAGSFSVECWVNPSNITQTGYPFMCQTNVGFIGLAFGYTTGLFKLDQAGSGGGIRVTSSSTYAANTWHHVAYTYDGTRLRLFVNGVLQGSALTAALSTLIAGPAVSIGTFSTSYFSGYVSNLRICRAAIPTSYQTSSTTVGAAIFTPSTTPLTTTSQGASNVTFLTCQDNRFIDNASALTFTFTGTPSVQAFSPFAPTAAYSTSVVGGSAYLDGTGDYLTVANAAPLQFDAGDFTIQCWVYRAVSGVAHTIAAKGSSTTGWVFSINASDQLNWTDTSTSNATTATIPAGSWTHVAAVRSGSTINLYINGVSRLNFANSTTYNQTSALTVFAGRTQANSFNGYVSGFEYVKGTALTIAVPTAPPTTANSPSLLLNFTNAGIYDSAAKNDMETVGNAQVASGTYSPTATGTSGLSTIVVSSATGLKIGQSVTGTGIGTNAVVTNIVTTTVTLSVANSGTVSGTMTFTEPVKFGTTSMYFDGTGDYLLMPDSPNLQLGTGDFTIDGWVYLAATGVAYGIISKGTASTGWSVNVTSGNKLQFSYTATALTGATSLSSATWYYFAVVRSGSATGNLKIYLNSSVDATSAGAVTTNFNQTDSMYVGADRAAGSVLNGYLDEVRVTKYARTITTPTAAFPIQ